MTGGRRRSPGAELSIGDVRYRWTPCLHGEALARQPSRKHAERRRKGEVRPGAARPGTRRFLAKAGVADVIEGAEEQMGIHQLVIRRLTAAGDDETPPLADAVTSPQNQVELLYASSSAPNDSARTPPRVGHG